MKNKGKVRLTGRLKAYKSGDKGLVIEGFANKAVVDRGKDLIEPGAWTKDDGLASFMKNPTILFDHGMDPNVGGLPIGKAIEVTAKDDGLFIKAKLSQSNHPAISAIRTLVEEQMLRAFSVGFNPKEMEPDQEKNINVIKSAELFEVSVVGIPMNQESLFDMESKSGKKYMRKSIDQIGAMLCNDKGAEFAARAHEAIDDLVEKGRDRNRILDELALACDVSDMTLLDILAGNLMDIPEQVAQGFKQFFGEDFKGVSNVERGKTKGDGNSEGDEENSDKSETEDSSDEDKGSGDSERGDDSEGDGEDEESSDKAFKESVNEMIVELVNNGKSADDAVTEAILSVREKTEEPVSPTKEMFAEFFANAEKASDDLKTKQSEQGGEVDESEVATPVQTAPSEDEFGSPMLDQMKQTNVLLGTLIKEVQLQTMTLKGMNVQSPGSTGENSDNQGTIDQDDEKSIRLRLEKQREFMASMNDRLKKLDV